MNSKQSKKWKKNFFLFNFLNFFSSKLKDKEEWMRAFKKVKNITSTNYEEVVFTPNKDQIGVFFYQKKNF